MRIDHPLAAVAGSFDIASSHLRANLDVRNCGFNTSRMVDLQQRKTGDRAHVASPARAAEIEDAVRIPEPPYLVRKTNAEVRRAAG